MAIEKTSLDESIIKEIVYEHYGIKAEKINRLSLGTANCYKVKCSDKSYFLKEYPSWFKEQDLQREWDVNKYLIKNRFPTAEFICTKTGKGYIRHMQKYIAIQEYIEGETFANHDLPDQMLFQAAELLGKIHCILRDINLEKGMDEEWINNYDAGKLVNEYDFLIQNLDAEDKLYGHIKEDLLYKKELAQRIEKYGKCFDKVTYKSSHGDFTSLQYVCDERGIKAVIDFASAEKLPAVWEIMRSYTQSSTECKEGTYIDIDKLIKYVKRYLQHSQLTKDDLKYLPYIYLYQLGRSKYGYKEYIIGNVENKEELLKFAMWRTNICKTMEKQADKIVAKLSGIEI